jgi:hypothetical protein
MSTPSHTEASVETKELEAGRELDAEVAEKIFDWRWFARLDFDDDPDTPSNTAWLFPADSEERDTGGKGLFGEPITVRHGVVGPFTPCKPRKKSWACNAPRYSTDIKDAWEVVEMMLAQGWHFNLECEPESGESPCAMFYKGRDSYGERDAHSMSATTVPLAICLAALKATTDAKE